MVLFVQRYQAIQDYTDQNKEIQSAGVASEKKSLVVLVSDIAYNKRT